MKPLSKKEWIAVAAGVAFVGYTLFGGNVVRLFNQSTMNSEDNAAALRQSDRGGVIVNDIVVGTGAAVGPGTKVTAHYILSLEDGTVIQNSKDLGRTFEFTVGAHEVIPGWEIGLEGMKVGGTRTIIIPPSLAYGSVERGPIPANSTLVFTVELLAVEPAPTATPQ